MTENRNEYRLTQEIIALSRASDWDRAKLEWILEGVYMADEPETCLCGHFPIIEICGLRNLYNDNYTEVGNVCVKKFLGLPSDKIFRSVKKVRKDEEKSLNAETIQYAYNKGWMSIWERDFSMDTIRKLKPSLKQLAKRVEINRKIMRNMRRGGGN